MPPPISLVTFNSMNQKQVKYQPVMNEQGPRIVEPPENSDDPGSSGRSGQQGNPM